MNDFSPFPDDVQAELNGALAEVFRPLVRYALLKGVKFQSLSELLKAVYVEQARRLPDQEASRVNISQVSVATGLHRREIARLLVEAKDSVIPTEPPLEAEVFTRWITDQRFRAVDGNPMELPRIGNQVSDASFESLARTVTKDIHPRAVLDSMLRLKIVEETAAGLISLRAQAFVPQPEHKQMLEFLAANLHDHAAAATRNLEGETDPYLEQSVYGQALSEQTISQLHATARSLWQNMFNQFVQSATQLEDQDRHNPQATQRFRLGIYFYSETQPLKETP
jgi:Family of unknown function (DUF6502)